MYVHPDFSWETMENDFMIFKIRPVTTPNLQRAIASRPVRLNRDPNFPTSGLPLNVIGYGAVKENGPQSSNLLQAVVNSIASVQCDKSYGGAVYPATQMWYVDVGVNPVLGWVDHQALQLIWCFSCSDSFPFSLKYSI
jgi:hypothetical protein